VEELQ